MQREKERAVAILDRRTAFLASREAEAAARATPRRSVIVWALGEGLAAMDVGHVAAVLPFAGCALVPTQAAACLGVIGRAGRFYSVIGMRALAGLAPSVPAAETADPDRPAHLLLLRGAPSIALAVDRVLGRFDLADTGATLDLGGRLVALMEPGALRAVLGGVRPERGP
jgi:chemotaxis signal transduction protein